MSAGWSLSIFRAVILGNFLFIQRLGMRLSICQLNIYYMHIGLVPQIPGQGHRKSLFPHVLSERAHLMTCKEELKGSTFPKTT